MTEKHLQHPAADCQFGEEVSCCCCPRCPCPLWTGDGKLGEEFMTAVSLPFLEPLLMRLAAVECVALASPELLRKNWRK